MKQSWYQCKFRTKTKVDGKSMYSDIKLALGENKNWTTWIKYCFVFSKCFVVNETGKILMQWYQARLSRQSDSLRNISNISKKPFPRACWQSFKKWQNLQLNFEQKMKKINTLSNGRIKNFKKLIHLQNVNQKFLQDFLQQFLTVLEMY